MKQMFRVGLTSFQNTNLSPKVIYTPGKKTTLPLTAFLTLHYLLTIIAISVHDLTPTDSPFLLHRSVNLWKKSKQFFK